MKNRPHYIETLFLPFKTQYKIIMHNAHYELFYTLHLHTQYIQNQQLSYSTTWLLDFGRYHDETFGFCFLKLHYPYSIAIATEIMSLFPMDTLKLSHYTMKVFQKASFMEKKLNHNMIIKCKRSFHRLVESKMSSKDLMEKRAKYPLYLASFM